MLLDKTIISIEKKQYRVSSIDYRVKKNNFQYAVIGSYAIRS